MYVFSEKMCPGRGEIYIKTQDLMTKIYHFRTLSIFNINYNLCTKYFFCGRNKK